MAKSDKKSKALTVIIIVVLGLWAAVGGAYLARLWVHQEEEQKPVVAPSQTAWDRERWSGIYQERTKIGYTVSRMKSDATGFQLWSNTRIKIRIMETKTDIRLDLQARLNPDYSLRELAFEALSDFMEIRARGKMEGNDLNLTVTTAGQDIQHRLHFQKPPILEIEWLLEEKLKTAKPGDEFAFSIFEPMSQAEMPVKVKVLGAEDLEVMGKIVPCWKLEVALAGQTEWAWAAKSDRRVVKEYQQATGFTTLLETRAEAMKVDWEKAGDLDLISTFMVPANNVLIKPRGVTYLKARLTGAPLTGLDLTTPGRQTAAGSTVEIKMEVATPAAGYGLPISSTLPQKAAEFAPFLAPTVFIQSDRPEILAAAREATGNATDAVTAVDKLVTWVATEVKPSMVASIPSALEVLEKKRGACKEHTVLFVAMARALGIPARTVSGIVYSDQQMLEGFYYHAWAEVYLADPEGQGLWVTVDPTFNQNPADATHIKLKAGDLEQMIELMQVVGLLKVQVEEYH